MHQRLFGKVLRFRDNIFKQNLPENYSKSTKIVITARKFSKIFRRSMPPDPPRAFLVSQSASNLFCRKKILLKKCGNYAAPSKFLATQLDLSMSLPTNINKRNAAINHGKTVSTKSQNEYPGSAKINRPFIVDWHKDHSSRSWLEYPDVLDTAFCFIAVSSMLQ